MRCSLSLSPVPFIARVCPLESAVRCEHVMLMEMRGPGRVSWTLWSVVRYRQGVWSEYGKAVSREEAVLYGFIGWIVTL